MFPFMAGRREHRSAMHESGEGSDPQAPCTHAKPAGSVVRCSNVPRNPPLSDLYIPRHTLELVEMLYDHRHSLTATNTHRL
jgi:hypothetical protein